MGSSWEGAVGEGEEKEVEGSWVGGGVGEEESREDPFSNVCARHL